LIAQIGVILFVLTLTFSMAVYVGNPWLLGLMVTMATALVLYAAVQRQHFRRFTAVIYPVITVCMLYLFLEGMTLSAYLRYAVAYNVNQLLAHDRHTPVYVYQLDSIVAWELGIYRSAPSEGVQSAEQLPRKGAPYLLVIKESQLSVLDGLPLQIETLAQEGLAIQPFLTTNASKAQIIDALALAFETGKISIPNDPALIAELLAYESERLPSGLIRYGAPDGLHDDRVMSLAIAYYASSVYSGFGLGVA